MSGLGRSGRRRLARVVARFVVRYGEGRPGRDAVWAAASRAGLPEQAGRRGGRTRYGFRAGGEQANAMPRSLYWFGHWEPLLSVWVRSSLRPGDVFVDVGANLGYFTMLAARAVGRRGGVVAFEPSAATRRALEANLRRNRLGNVRVVAAAAGERPGTVTLYRAPWNDAETSTVPGAGLEPDAEVRSVRVLDELTEDELARTRIVKIDVEGAEGAVLEGMARSARRLPPDAEIAVEVHPEALRCDGRSTSDLIEALEPFGYRAAWLPRDISAAAHLRRPDWAQPRTDEPPASEVFHLILSRRAPATEHPRAAAPSP